MIVVDLDRVSVVIILDELVVIDLDVKGMSWLMILVVQTMAIGGPTRMASQPTMHAVTAAAGDS